MKVYKSKDRYIVSLTSIETNLLIDTLNAAMEIQNCAVFCFALKLRSKLKTGLEVPEGSSKPGLQGPPQPTE